MVNKITDIWKSEQELQEDIELVRKPFDLWHSQKQTFINDIETLPEEAAFEILCERYGVKLASQKLELILDNCFAKSTYEYGGWARS